MSFWSHTQSEMRKINEVVGSSWNDCIGHKMYAIAFKAYFPNKFPVYSKFDKKNTFGTILHLFAP